MLDSFIALDGFRSRQKEQGMSTRKRIDDRPASAAGLVEYPAGAIGSREILKKKTGSVTLFAFDGGQGLSERTAPFDARVQALDGEAETRIAGQRHRVQAGELIRLPAGPPHAWKARRRFKMLRMMWRA